jgi:hypothetical protein
VQTVSQLQTRLHVHSVVDTRSQAHDVTMLQTHTGTVSQMHMTLTSVGFRALTKLHPQFDTLSHVHTRLQVHLVLAIFPAIFSGDEYASAATYNSISGLR